jgi:hypothetical protein
MYVADICTNELPPLQIWFLAHGAKSEFASSNTLDRRLRLTRVLYERFSGASSGK